MKSKFKIKKLTDFIHEVSVRNNKTVVSEVFSVTNSKGFVKSTDYFDKEVFSKNISNYKIVKPNQFAYNPSRINVGSIDFLRTDFEVAVSPLYVVFECQNNLSADYLLRYLKSPLGNSQIRSKTRGAVRESLNFSSLSEIDIPVASIQEQRKISKLLASIEQIIQNREESISLVHKLMQELFIKFFGHYNQFSNNHSIQPLDTVATKITDGEHGTVPTIEQGKLYLMARNISDDNSINLNEVSFISQQDHERIYKRCKPEVNDLLLVCVGATIGRCALVPEMEEFSLTRNVALIKPDKKKINSQFLLHLFNTTFIQRQIKYLSNAAAQAGLYTGKIKEIEVPVPKMSLQNKFASIVEKVERIKGGYKQSLSELLKLQSSIGSRAFRGELDLGKIELDHIVPQSYGGGDVEENIGITTKFDNIRSANRKGSLLKIIVNQHFKRDSFSYQDLAEKIQASLDEEQYDYNKIKLQIFDSLRGYGDIRLEQYFNEDDKTLLLRLAK